MIKSRSSEDVLTPDRILSKISEVDIFAYYCNSFKQLGVKFCSEIRQDKKPGVYIILWKGRLLYKDFAYPDHKFDCFGYVMAAYNVSFYSALRIIDNDFGLNLASSKEEMAFTKGYLGYQSKIKIENKKVTIIKKKSRPWKRKDADFWSQYLISKKTLTKFAVSPISHYWINDSRFTCKLSYAYKIGRKYKIYSPYEEVKWMSNTNSKQIQGYDQLPNKGDLCIIASSLKDVMCLFEMGISAVAMQSEMQLPLRSTIEELKQRFKQVAVFYDNDFTNPNNPGQTMAKKICKEYYPMKNILIPDEYQLKDPSDYVAHFKQTKGLQTLIDIQL
jgi:5S rRNA maturation endonuclease (ribonuclease M5)